MKKRVSSISIKQSAKFIAVMYFIISAIILIPLGIFTMIQGQIQEGALMFLFPLAYALLSCIFFAVFAFVYNIIAEMVGGMEFTIEDVE